MTGCLALLALTTPVATAQAGARHRTAVPAPLARLLKAKRSAWYAPFYLVQADSGRGATFEAYDNWDYVLLTNQPGNGTRIEVSLDGNGDFTFEFTSSTWAGYRTWCLSGNDIRLDESSCRTRWDIEDAGEGLYYVKVVGTKRYVKTTTVPDRERWLLAAGELREPGEEFVKFRVVNV